MSFRQKNDTSNPLRIASRRPGPHGRVRNSPRPDRNGVDASEDRTRAVTPTPRRRSVNRALLRAVAKVKASGFPRSATTVITCAFQGSTRVFAREWVADKSHYISEEAAVWKNGDW
jgi:hypothetical protein